MVNGGDGPSDADAEEDIDGVAASHIADRIVGVLVLNGGDFGGEGVGNGSAQGHEGNRRHRILEEGETAEKARG